MLLSGSRCPRVPVFDVWRSEMQSRGLAIVTWRAWSAVKLSDRVTVIVTQSPVSLRDAPFLGSASRRDRRSALKERQSSRGLARERGGAEVAARCAAAARNRARTSSRESLGFHAVARWHATFEAGRMSLGVPTSMPGVSSRTCVVSSRASHGFPHVYALSRVSQKPQLASCKTLGRS